MTPTSVVSPVSVPPSPALTAPHAMEMVPLWRSGVVLLLGLLVCTVYWVKPPPHIPPQAGVVMHLPAYVNVAGGFVGEDAEVTAAEKQILPKDTEFVRKNYSDYQHHDLFCGIVLSGATQQSIHRPEVCLIAQGWSIVNQEIVPIQLKSGKILSVENLTIKKAATFEGKPITLTKYNMYWFVGEHVTTPYHHIRILLSSWDRIVHNRAHRWAYVTVAATITKDLYPNGMDAAQTKALMIAFIREAVPSFQKDEMTAVSAP